MINLSAMLMKTQDENEQLRARLAEVEAQRDMLKNVIIFIRDECDWEPTMHESGGDERIGNVITDTLAKLEEK